ncbi:MAG: hypothetical protein Q4A07_08475 [Coriobacteriales bacterium]|nr:hypothetical protein [Coriobacteriales bacterium]
MKIRTDFVTNSSSSSFILARKAELSDRQKQALVDFIERHFLGQVILNPNNTEDEIQRVFEEEWEFKYDESLREEARNALKNGMSVYCGEVVFEEADYYMSDIFQSVWKLLESNADEEHAFVPLDDDLSY